MNNIKAKGDNGIIDLSLGISRQRIRIDGDDEKILLINLSDLGIVDRLNEAYPKLKELEEEFSNIKTEESSELEMAQTNFSSFGKQLKVIDDKMRELIDFVFDSNVSEVCVGKSSICSIRGGRFFYEIIIDSLSKLYNTEISKEATAVVERINKHSNKYMKARGKKT